jgi:hypothetical protein
MTERFKGTGSGKGDKSRIADYNKYCRNSDKIFEKKTLQFWCVWEGYDSDFNTEDLEEGEKISYSEYMSRIINLKKLS